MDHSTSFAHKLLKLFLILISDGEKHFLGDLKKTLNCSSQTVLRLISEIKPILGDNLNLGKDGRCRWFKLVAFDPKPLEGDCAVLNLILALSQTLKPYQNDKLKKQIQDLLRFIAIKHLSEKTLKESFTFYPQGSLSLQELSKMLEVLTFCKEKVLLCDVTVVTLNLHSIEQFYFLPKKFLFYQNEFYIVGAKFKENAKNFESFVALKLNDLANFKATSFKVSTPCTSCTYQDLGFEDFKPVHYQIAFKDNRLSAFIKERTWSEVQHIKTQDDGTFILDLCVSDEKALQTWLKSLCFATKISADPLSLQLDF